MFRGFYIASNALFDTQRKINTISNNISNVNTAGYKSDTAISNTFNEELILIQGKKNTTGTFQYKFADVTYSKLEQGAFEFTERPLDVAIQGPVYFNIESQGQAMLTRNGQFTIDNEGYLCLGTSGRVLGENGAIYLGTSDFSISNDGSIFIDGQYSDRLLLTYIPENSNIDKDGENLFTAQDGSEIPEDIEFSIIQGSYERSNVNVAEEMTKAMESQRAFESLSQALQMLDTINQRTVSDIGKKY